ncbi:MAG TPA: carbohydrate kinase family protein [Roseiflexaceae bacterium]|nr:carbohydrate kinase family protein [Roseiflexaceae bacterium]
MALEVLSLGDLVADMVVPIERFPIRPQEHQMVPDIMLEAGGTGNFLVLATRLGLHAKALGVVGEDFYGQQVCAALRQEGVDLEAVIIPPNSRTTTSIVLVDSAAEHVFVWMGGTGARQQFDPAWRALIERTDVVFSTGYALLPDSTFAPSAVRDCLGIAHELRKPVFFDLGPAAALIDRADIEEVIRRTTVLLATSEELAEWTGGDDPRENASSLLSHGPSMVVAKLGPQGCLIVTAQEQEQIGAFPVTVRNTAGAGDAFSAACVFGYLQGYSLREIGLLANAVGALAVAELGTGVHLPQRHAIARLLAEHGYTFFD